MCTHHRKLLTKSNDGCGKVIGFSLLQHRSNFHFDMTLKCDSVAAFLVEWKISLNTGIGRRYSPTKKVLPVASNITTKAAAITITEQGTSKRQRRCCCIE